MNAMDSPMDAARGRWRSVLLELGIPREFLSGKHGPCPLPGCGGKDRFRYTNHENDGMYICSVCGNGDGWKFLQRYHGWSAKHAADEIRRVCGEGVAADPKVRPISDQDRRRMLNNLWGSARPIERGDMVSLYLESRSILWPFDVPWPPALRFCRECPVKDVPGVKHLPAMLAMVHDAQGKAATIHRTYIGHKRKANIERPRQYMPGPFPKGGAVRLCPLDEGDEMGIAEGIETAIAAHLLFRIPVWSALNAQNLGEWKPPKGINKVHIFGDNDLTYTGQRYAFTLAHKLATDTQKNFEVIPCVPNFEGEDWLDIYERGRRMDIEDADRVLFGKQRA